MDSINNSELIDGIEITPLKQILDERGGVFHIMKKSDSGFLSFGEAYLSKINKDKIKAWKNHREMTQNFCVPFGSLKLVLYDDRDLSPTQGVINTFQLDDNNNYKRITIPPMIWYGFQCKSADYCLLLNIADIEHDPNESTILPQENNKIPYLW